MRTAMATPRGWCDVRGHVVVTFTNVIPVQIELGFVNRPFPSSLQSLFQSESKCEIFVMVISSNFNMNEK